MALLEHHPSDILKYYFRFQKAIEITKRLLYNQRLDFGTQQNEIFYDIEDAHKILSNRLYINTTSVTFVPPRIASSVHSNFESNEDVCNFLHASSFIHHRLRLIKIDDIWMEDFQ